MLELFFIILFAVLFLFMIKAFKEDKIERLEMRKRLMEDVEETPFYSINNGEIERYKTMLLSEKINSIKVFQINDTFYNLKNKNQYLIDGGVLNNFPVEQVINMGADIIIGVNVQDDLKDRDQLTEATKLLVQISNLQMIKKMENKRHLSDIYIKPDIANYSVVSFDKTSEIIKRNHYNYKGIYIRLEEINYTFCFLDQNENINYNNEVTLLEILKETNFYNLIKPSN